MIRAASVELLARGPLVASLGLAGEAALAVVAGGWLLHQAYASGPPAIVVGATTIVDPLTAVMIGVLVFGESPPASANVLTGEVAAAAVAVAGLLLLAAGRLVSPYQA